MPRAKRTPKTTPKTTEPTPTPAKPEPPTCARCGRELGWRDRFYVGIAATLCKTCHQRGQRKQRRGFVEFHPAIALVKQGEKTVEVPVRFNRAARRRPVAASVSAPRERKLTRAERRAKARTQKAQATATAAA